MKCKNIRLYNFGQFFQTNQLRKLVTFKQICWLLLEKITTTSKKRAKEGKNNVD